MRDGEQADCPQRRQIVRRRRVVPVRPHTARRAPPFAPVAERVRGNEERHVHAVIAAIQHERANDRERDPRRRADLCQENLRGLPSAKRVAEDDPEEEEVGEECQNGMMFETEDL